MNEELKDKTIVSHGERASKEANLYFQAEILYQALGEKTEVKSK